MIFAEFSSEHMILQYLGYKLTVTVMKSNKLILSNWLKFCQELIRKNKFEITLWQHFQPFRILIQVTVLLGEYLWVLICTFHLIQTQYLRVVPRGKSVSLHCVGGYKTMNPGAGKFRNLTKVNDPKF